MAAIATSGDSDLLRGMPCWSTTVRRTVRRSSSPIRRAAAAAAAACSSVYKPWRATKPCWPTPLTGPLRNSFGEVLPIWLPSCPVLTFLADHDIKHPGGEVVWLNIGERNERFGPLY